MKKLVLFIITLGLMASLSACAAQPSSDSEEQNLGSSVLSGSDARIDTDSQLHLIASQSERWRVSDEMDAWGYAVTDIDQNGRLELLSSQCQGTGFYSTTRVFEVSEDGSALNEYNGFLSEYDSHPDFLFDNEYRALYADGAYHLMIEDMIKDGPMTHHSYTNSVSLLGGVNESVILGHRTVSNEMVDDDVVTTTEYFDSGDNKISEDDYYALPEKCYPDASQYRFSIAWQNNASLDGLDQDALVSMLTESFVGFAIKSLPTPYLYSTAYKSMTRVFGDDSHEVYRSEDALMSVELLLNDGCDYGMVGEVSLTELMELREQCELRNVESIPCDNIGSYPAQRIRFECGSNEDTTVVDATAIWAKARTFVYIVSVKADTWYGYTKGYEEGAVEDMVNQWVSELRIQGALS